MKKEMGYSLVVVTFDQRFEKYFKPLLREIKRQRPNLEVLIQINGPYKEGRNGGYIKNILSEIQKYDNVYAQFYTKFSSLSKLWNRGIQNSSNDINLVLNDDIEIKPGFFDWLDEKISFHNNEYFVINDAWCYFVMSRDFLNSINWFDERLLGIGWEDLDVSQHKCPQKTLRSNLIQSFDKEGLEKPAQKKIKGMLKYTEFNHQVYTAKQAWILKHKTLPELKQYPYYTFEKENYDKLSG
jgi:hypothetical protein